MICLNYMPLNHSFGRSWLGRTLGNGGTIQVEPGIPDDVIKELLRRGHELKRVNVNGGGYQGIVIDPKSGMLHGGSEARKDGAAVGY